MLLLMPPFKKNSAKYLVNNEQVIYDFVKRYEATGSIGWLPGSGRIRKSKGTDEITKIR